MSTLDEVPVGSLGVDRGLSDLEARTRLKRYGLNKLPEAVVDSLFTIFIHQFRSPLIYILLVACTIVFATGEVFDGSLILFVLVFNAIIGTIQEGKAQNTLLALKKFVETKATVLRDGVEVIIDDVEVVPGDLLILQEGEKVSADARVIFSSNLKVDEAALTGESEPVHKTIAQELSTDTVGFVYKGTNIVAGNGRAVVVATGLETKIGALASKLSTIDTEIPLKANIRYLSRLIILATAVISTLVFALGIRNGRSAVEMFNTVVALSVSIVPEGLPIVVTLILAMGVSRMSKRNALVKKLQAVEALGQARVIAVDKTGTITKNELVIQKLYVGDRFFDVTGVGYEPHGTFALDGLVVDAANHPELLFAGKIAAFCAGARVVYSEEEKRWRVSGDPTEAALLVVSQKLGFHKQDLEKESVVLAEIPFDYRLKYHALLHSVESKNFLTVVGAPEVILGLTKNIWEDGKSRKYTTAERDKLELIVERLSQEGLRVIAFGVDPDFGKTLKPEKIQHLTFGGFYAMKDATRPEAASAVQKAVKAGIKVVMITGDHRITARAIARDIGIWREGDEVLTGAEIDALDEGELSKKIGSVSVFARVNPEHKLRIIEAYRARGEVVAMTGDGVNDAPSLVAADLGVGMGITGTEVAKEASDIVLLDDNLGSIVSAIEEGRSIYRTIKRVILYLFSTSLGEVFTITGALLMSLSVPLLPAQIIWLNFVTDGFLVVSLAMEPKEKHLLDGSFEKPKKYLIDRFMAWRIVIMAMVMGLGTLFVFNNYYEADLAKAWTMSLTTLAAFQWLNAWNCRSEYKSIFRTSLFSNRFLLGSTVLVVVLQILALYTPFMQKFLRTVPIDVSDWVFLLSVSTLIVLAEEIRKWWYRRSFIK